MPPESRLESVESSEGNGTSAHMTGVERSEESVESSEVRSLGIKGLQRLSRGDERGI